MLVLGLALGFVGGFLLAAAAVANVREKEQAAVAELEMENARLQERVKYLEGVCAASSSSSMTVS